MSDTNSDKGNIFVWGHFGKKLQKLDNKRYFAITQNSPAYHLSRIYNDNLEKIIDKIGLDNCNMDEIFKEMENENYLDNLFRQISYYLTNNADMVSIGSTLTGELEKSVKLGRIIKPDNKISDGELVE